MKREKKKKKLKQLIQIGVQQAEQQLILLRQQPKQLCSLLLAFGHSSQKRTGTQRRSREAVLCVPAGSWHIILSSLSQVQFTKPPRTAFSRKHHLTTAVTITGCLGGPC